MDPIISKEYQNIFKLFYLENTWHSENKACFEGRFMLTLKFISSLYLSNLIT